MFMDAYGTVTAEEWVTIPLEPPQIQFLSSAGEQRFYTAKVTGSIPVGTTNIFSSSEYALQCVGTSTEALLGDCVPGTRAKYIPQNPSKVHGPGC